MPPVPHSPDYRNRLSRPSNHALRAGAQIEHSMQGIQCPFLDVGDSIANEPESIGFFSMPECM